MFEAYATGLCFTTPGDSFASVTLTCGTEEDDAPYSYMDVATFDTSPMCVEDKSVYGKENVQTVRLVGIETDQSYSEVTDLIYAKAVTPLLYDLDDDQYSDDLRDMNGINGTFSLGRSVNFTKASLEEQMSQEEGDDAVDYSYFYSHFTDHAADDKKDNGIREYDDGYVIMPPAKESIRRRRSDPRAVDSVEEEEGALLRRSSNAARRVSGEGDGEEEKKDKAAVRDEVSSANLALRIFCNKGMKG
eukprot:gene36791-45392_t